MSGQAPGWFHKNEAIRGWVQTGGLIVGVIAFFLLVNWRLTRSEALKNEIEADVRAKLAPYDVRVRTLEAERGQYDTRRSAAEANVAEADAKRIAKPLLLLKPSVELGSDHRDVCEVQCDITFSNAGVVDANIRNVRLEVYRAISTPKVSDLIQRTQEIADLEATLNRQPLTEEEKAAWNQALNQRSNLDRECPHGQLFSVSEKSLDVEWEHIKRLSENRGTNIKLRPGQAVFEQFNYVLTQSLQLHRCWFRLTIIAELDDGSSQTFRFIVPTRRPPVYASPDHRTAYSRHAVSRYDSSDPIYRWSPDTPLAPVEQQDAP